MKFDTSKYSRDLRKYYQLPAVQSSLTLVISVFLVAIFISLALRPTLISITNLKTTINDAEKTAQVLKTKVKNLQTVSSQLEIMKPLLPMLNRSIPDKNVMYSEFITAIEAIAIQSGATLDTETLGASLLFSRIESPFDPDKNHGVVSLKYSISITGLYPQLSQFLNTFLSMERIVMIDAVNIAPVGTSRNTNSKSGSTLKLDIAGNVFYVADEAQIKQILEDKKGKK